MTGNNISGSTYDLGVSDVLAPYLRFTSAGGCVVNIPGGVDDTFALWDEVTLRSVTDGEVSLDWDTGVVVNFPPNKVGVLSGNGATVALKKVGEDEWDACGLLQDVGSV